MLLREELVPVQVLQDPVRVLGSRQLVRHDRGDARKQRGPEQKVPHAVIGLSEQLAGVVVEDIVPPEAPLIPEPAAARLQHLAHQDQSRRPPVGLLMDLRQRIGFHVLHTVRLHDLSCLIFRQLDLLPSDQPDPVIGAQAGKLRRRLGTARHDHVEAFGHRVESVYDHLEERRSKQNIAGLSGRVDMIK
jgi:hypothetical protein